MTVHRTTLKFEGLFVFSACEKEHADSARISHLLLLRRRVTRREPDHRSLSSAIAHFWALNTCYSHLVHEITFKLRI